MHQPTENKTETLAALRELLGEDSVLPEDALDAHAHDWSDAPPCRPLAVVRPRDTAAVSRLLAWCHAHHQPVIAHGGLTGLAGSATPLGGEIAVSFERMNRIERIDTDSGLVVLEAGAVLQTVQEACAAEGALFALDLGARGSCRIGGNLSTNAGGNRVIRYGVSRDLVLGLEAVLADGTILPMMHETVKNTTGYDLKHLFIGSEGTLGLITRAVLKLHPLPKDVHTALVAVDSFDAALRLLRHAQSRLSGQLSAFELMWHEYYHAALATGIHPPLDEGYPFYVLLDLQGGQPEADAARFAAMLESAMEDGLILDGTAAHSLTQTQTIWAVRDAIAHIMADHPPVLTYDIAVRRASIGQCAEAIRAALHRENPALHPLFFGHVGDSNLHVVLTEAPADHQDQHRIDAALYGAVRQFHGAVSAEHGIGVVKKPWLAHSRSPQELALMRTLKATLDPHNILNPGKIL